MSVFNKTSFHVFLIICLLVTHAVTAEIKKQDDVEKPDIKSSKHEDITSARSYNQPLPTGNSWHSMPDYDNDFNKFTGLQYQMSPQSIRPPQNMDACVNIQQSNDIYRPRLNQLPVVGLQNSQIYPTNPTPYLSGGNNFLPTPDSSDMSSALQQPFDTMNNYLLTNPSRYGGNQLIYQKSNPMIVRTQMDYLPQRLPPAAINGIKSIKIVSSKDYDRPMFDTYPEINPFYGLQSSGNEFSTNLRNSPITVWDNYNPYSAFFRQQTQ